MKKIRLFPLLAIIVITFTILWQFPLKGKVPFPGHLLVGRLFPWNQQQWPDYPLGVPYKEFFAADTVRQTYPWRQLAVSQLKQGQIPWWNPHTFSGNPLLANLQSAPFYPLNFFYLLGNFDNIWILQVLLQPILAATFTYLFARSLKLSSLASIFAGIVFAFSGYMTIWLELNTVGQAALWLPLALYIIQVSLKHPKRYLFLTIPLISSFFAGHLQSSLYLVLISFAYLLFNRYQHRRHLKSPRHHFIYPLTALIFSALVFSIQLIPALKLFTLSPRSGVDADIFHRFLLPYSHLITFIAPNFFGNPARGNFWGQDYGEFMAYFGLIPFVLYLSSFFIPKKRSTQKFFLAATVVSLVLMLPNPIAYLPKFLHIPILSSSAASRILFLFQFSASILAAYSLDYLTKKPKLLAKPLKLLAPIVFLILIFVLARWQLSHDTVIKAQFKVSFRNLAVPSALFTITLVSYLLTKTKHLHVKYLPKAFLILTIFDLAYFTNGYLPFTEPKYIFPETPPFSFLHQNAGLHRFFGDYTASVTSNVWMPYGLYAPEGYDSLYLTRYGKLIHAAANQGQLYDDFPRSDADLPSNQDDTYRQRLQSLLDVRYLIHEIEPTGQELIPDTLRFPVDRYQILWEQDRYQIYQNIQTLPRAFLTPYYYEAQNDQEIADLIFNPYWDFTQAVILESEPNTSLGSSSPQTIDPDQIIQANEQIDFPDQDPKQALARQYASVWEQSTPQSQDLTQLYQNKVGDSVEIISYQPTHIEIQVNTSTPQFLFLSDNYYPDWQAYIKDSKTTLPIYRANFSFRSVFVPSGNHTIIFSYQPNFNLFE